MAKGMSRIFELLQAKHGINEEFVADQLALVIKGEHVEDTYAIDAKGIKHLVKKKVVKKPADIMAGLAVLDSVSNAGLGLMDAHDSSRKSKRLYLEHLPDIPDGSTGDVVQREYEEFNLDELETESE